MLVILGEAVNDCLIPFELPAAMFHRIEYEDALGDIVVLMSGEPVGEDSIRGLIIFPLLFEDLHLDSRGAKGFLERVKLFLSLS